MGVKTGAGGMNILERDVKSEDSKIGRQVSALAKAKKGGAGIGGLLGSVVGFMIAGPVGAAIGGGLGALGGSKLGGATSGTSQADILGGKFRQQSRVNMATDIAKQEFSDVGMAAISGYMNAGTIGKGLDAFKAGASGGSGLLGKLGGGIGGLTEAFVPGMKEFITKAMAKEALQAPPGSSTNILDIVKKTQSGPGAVMGGTASASAGGYGGGAGLLGSQITDSAIGNMNQTNMPVPEMGGTGGYNPPHVQIINQTSQLFPGKSPEDAAAEMGMSMEEFNTWLQGMQ